MRLRFRPNGQSYLPRDRIDAFILFDLISFSCASASPDYSEASIKFLVRSNGNVRYSFRFLNTDCINLVKSMIIVFIHDD